MINNDADFKIAMKLAAMMSLDEMVAEYEELDLSGIKLNEKVTRRIRWASSLSRIREAYVASSVNKVIVSILLVGTILFTAVVSIQPVRAALWNTIITWYEDYIGVIFEAPKEYPKIIEKIKIPEIPNGWAMEIIDEDKIGITIMITGLEDEFIIYRQRIYTDDEIWIDNTECRIDEIELDDGTKAYLYRYEDGRLSAHWVNEYIFTLEGENVTSESLVNIVNNINQ